MFLRIEVFFRTVLFYSSGHLCVVFLSAKKTPRRRNFSLGDFFLYSSKKKNCTFRLTAHPSVRYVHTALLNLSPTEGSMAKSTTKSRREKREAQLLQDKNAAWRLETLVKFFQTEVIHDFLPITWVKAFLLLILLVPGTLSAALRSWLDFARQLYAKRRSFFNKTDWQSCFTARRETAEKAR